MKQDPKFYDVDREYYLSMKPIDRRLSGNFLSYDYFPVERYYKVGNDYIVRNFYSLFQFVTGERSPSISIKPDTYSSWCSLTTNQIQIGTQLLADGRYDQQQKVDILFAVMLHEMYHKRYTISDLGRHLGIPVDSRSNYYESEKMKPGIDKLFFSKLYTSVFNILEDHRIERLGMRDFPGYVFFFDELREHALERHANKKLFNKKKLDIVMEYLMTKVLLPELLPEFNKEIAGFSFGVDMAAVAQKHSLIKIISELDTFIADNHRIVYSDRVGDIIKATEEIYKILQPPGTKRTEPEKEYECTHSDFMVETESGLHFQDPGYKKGIGELQEAIDKVIEAEAKAAAPGGDTAGTSRNEKITIMSCHDKMYENVVIQSPTSRSVDKVIEKAAMAMSKNISRSLGFFSTRMNQINQSFELTEGEIDEDELHSIRHNTNIFYEESAKPGFEFDVGLLIDQSGSMRGKNIQNAKIAMLGCGYSFRNSKHVNLFEYGHSVGEQLIMYEYYNTKRKQVNLGNVYAVEGGGGNADGYAIAKMGEIMLRDSKAKKKLLLVFSDGMPSAAMYGGEAAEQHVKQVVNLLETKGFKVVQICMDNIARSSFMFNDFIPYDAKGDFILKIKQLLQKFLNTFIENS